MITGIYDHKGRPVISVWVQAVRSPLEKTGLKIPVDFVIATGAKRTILGAADAARLGIKPHDTRAPDDQDQVYWQHHDQPLRSIHAEINFQDDWKTPDRTFSIDIVDFFQPIANHDLPSFIGMDIMENWEIILDPSKNLVKLIPQSGALTPPDKTPSPDGEPHTVDQAFTVMTDRTHQQTVLVTSEDFRKVAHNHISLDGIPKYRQGHKQPQVQSTVDGIPMNFHIETYTSAAGRLQIWMQASMPHQPEQLVATARFSWAATGKGAERAHDHIKAQMQRRYPAQADAGPTIKTT